MLLTLLAALPLQAPVTGEPAPSIVLPTIQGEETVDLSAYRGKKVLLIQFASW